MTITPYEFAERVDHRIQFTGADDHENIFILQGTLLPQAFAERVVKVSTVERINLSSQYSKLAGWPSAKTFVVGEHMLVYWKGQWRMLGF